MEKNGQNSCTGNSRHIDIRYFFVKDRVEKGEMNIEYCPTGMMLADYFTKPLQGSLFNKFRDVIMGFAHISLRHEDARIKERENITNEYQVIPDHIHDERNIAPKGGELFPSPPVVKYQTTNDDTCNNINKKGRRRHVNNASSSLDSNKINALEGIM